MAKTIVGLFDTFSEAQNVVQDLINSGFDRSKVSLVANDASGEYSKGYNGGTTTGATTVDDSLRGREYDRNDVGTGTDDVADHKTAEGAGTGAVAGTVVGGVLGLLVGVGALAIPGVGPVIAAGQLATVLGSTALGAGIGAAAGGLIGALVNLGVPEDDATYYAEGVKRGGSLVLVNAEDNNADKAYSIMQKHNAVDIKRRGEEWRESGWNDFDPNAQPYSSSEIESMRLSRTGNRAGVMDRDDQYPRA